MTLMKQPAVFIDRDGTLIEEVNFLSRVDDLSIFPFTANAVNSLKDSGFLVIIVTNQSGIGRGVYTETDMHAIHDAIQVELAGAIDAFYFCPHLPDAGCSCRKPGLGMIESAVKDFESDLSRSWIVGDKNIDVETGQAGGFSTALVLTGYGEEHQSTIERPPEIVAANLGEAVDRIVALASAEVVV